MYGFSDPIIILMLHSPVPWMISFHEKHGRYIKLSGERNTQATREGDTYDHGLVFTNRALRLGEVFQLRIEQLESKWAGSLRIGITTKNPNCPETRIARAVTDLFIADGRDYWILSGSKVHNGDFEQEYPYNIHSLNVNDVIGMQVTDSGELIFFVNGIKKGVAMKGIPTKKAIYAVFDVYGRTKQVSWQYYGAESLEELCKFQILKIIQDKEKLDELPLPIPIIEFLKCS